jgi:hypothetical protein
MQNVDYCNKLIINDLDAKMQIMKIVQLVFFHVNTMTFFLKKTHFDTRI